MAGNYSQKFETLENSLLLVVTAAYFVIGIWFLASVLPNLKVNPWPRIGLAGLSFVSALICFTISPQNQGRTLRKLLEELQREGSRVDDVVKLQQSVGTAGFFNRIGLTGIPLAVALFALVFCGLTFLAEHVDPNLITTFSDLTKLTAGAFIGSLTKSAKRPTQQQL